ncbi:MAG: bifunctional diaminohydroxyphosphoribosylaminopyrimidine deaminase/5-amino-6-(5-phosphoribosylamino)uracil reductase RibD [Sedimentisphaerales bacterium]|nr:bifunctional diaminohydroxyphosphoribosylaminopyrimidine deaminase/5-amino-6-(5-phosphoribosylamino)uracil reductase RibD [Sedimentisphaerales bacterium]
MDSKDEKYMQMALKLAEKGIGAVEPNPAVGAVVVKASQIVGKGWHKKFGQPHAEVNALEDCKSLGVNPEGATMYVTLEPCCQEGKTGPCTDAIIQAKIARVVAATIDPSEHASGKGIEQLRSANIEVQTGTCETDARLLNAPFIKYATSGKCWVILKWAQSIDGKLAWADSQTNRWISSEQSRKDVQKLRRRSQAILVGVNTVIADDPKLTVRPPKDQSPTRIVLDNHLKLPLGCRLLRTAGKVPVLIYTAEETLQSNQQKVQKLESKGAELLAHPQLPETSNLQFLLEQLSSRGIQQLLVEGGAKVITSFLQQHLADEVCVYIAPKILGSCGKVDMSESLANLERHIGLHYTDIKSFDGDIRLSGLTKDALKEISVT